MTHGRIVMPGGRGRAALVLMLAILAATAATLAARPSAAAGSKGSVTVGLLVPRSGTFQEIGADMRRSAGLYLKLHGRKLGGYDVKLLIEDEGAVASDAAGATRKLIDQGVDVITGVVNNTSGQAVSPLTLAAQIPVVSYNISLAPNDYWWPTAQSNYGQQKAVGGYLAKYARSGLYLMAADYSTGHRLADGVTRDYTAAGGKVIGTLYTPPFGATSDYQPYLSKVRDSNAKSLWCFYAGSDALTFVKQFSQFGLSGKVKLYSTYALTAGSLLDAEGSAALGVITYSSYSPTTKNKANEAFVAAYRKAFKTYPTEYSESQWASMIVLDMALSKLKGDASPAKIQSAIKSLGSIKSPRGTWNFGDGGQTPHEPDEVYYMRQVVRDKQGNLVNKQIARLGFWKADGTVVKGR